MIINLQRTQHDKKAEKSGGLVIRAKADDVMRLLMSKLETQVPPFIREVSVNVRHHFEKKKLYLAIHSRHGPECALPMIRSASFHFKGSNEPPIVRAQPPFEVEKQIASLEECIAKITLQLEEADELDDVSMVYTGAREALMPFKSEDDEANGAEVEAGVGRHKGEHTWTFVSQIVHYHSNNGEQRRGEDRAGKKARLDLE